MKIQKVFDMCKLNAFFCILWSGFTWAQDWKPAYIALEFEGPGVSVEVPKGWYALNNGAMNLIDNLTSTLLDKKTGKDESVMLLSLTDKENIEDPNFNLITIQFSPEIMLSQRDVAEASEAQKEVIFKHWRDVGYDSLKNVAYFSHIVHNGEITQAGANWYAKIIREVQMRKDLPKKIMESFVHMSNKGVVMITFSYLPDSKNVILPIRNYVTESLRMDTLRRAHGQENQLPKDYQTQFRAAMARAYAGSAKDQGSLGYCYEVGVGVTSDINKAVEWYQKASSNGDAFAQLKLGICYSKGLGVVKDMPKAVELWQLAAESGEVHAQEMLGYAYLKGDGVNRDLSTASRWFEVSAISGNPDAQRVLGYLYSEGIGRDKNAQEAVKWYLKAAQQGDGDSQQLLGFAFSKGYGVLKNDAEAVKWCRKAALKGSLKGQAFLGLAYATGKGIELNKPQAFAWWSLAKERGDTYSANNLTKLENVMTDSDKLEGEKLLADFRKLPR